MIAVHRYIVAPFLVRVRNPPHRGMCRRRALQPHDTLVLRRRRVHVGCGKIADAMTNRIISTESGDLQVSPPDQRILDGISRWPKRGGGIPGDAGGSYRIPFADEQGDLFGIQINFGYYESGEEAGVAFRVQRKIQTAVLARFVAEPIRATLLPCIYLLEEASGRAHTGYVLFGRSEDDLAARPSGQTGGPYDAMLGPGATTMMVRYLLSEKEVWTGLGLPERAMAGMELETYAGCGHVEFDFLIVDGRIVYTGRTLAADFPFWAPLVDGGVTEIFHLPSEVVAGAGPVS